MTDVVKNKYRYNLVEIKYYFPENLDTEKENKRSEQLQEEKALSDGR